MKIHCSMLCGLSLHQFVEQCPDRVCLVLPRNGKKITSKDPNNEMLTLCFTCISQYIDYQDESSENKEEFADEDLERSVVSFSCCGDEDMTRVSIIAPNYFPPLVAPCKS